MIFAVAGVVAIFASLACARLIAFRRGYPVQGASSGAAQGATLAAARSGTLAAGRGATAVDRDLVMEELPPPHARPCTAVELPRQKAASHEDEAQPGAQSEPRHQ
jgi:hypothetical protein